MKKNDRPLVVIVGPTAVGKTEISLHLAEYFQGEIISADSRTFYKGMDIGTAKPTPQEQSRVPHHLIDISPPDHKWSLALYLPLVKQTITDIHQRQKLPFLVGGTGQYIKAVLEGWTIPKVKPDPKLRKTLNAWADQIGPSEIRQRLHSLDPEAAAAIDGPNTRRIIRALEVILSSGKKFSEQKGKSGSMYQILQIGLSRPREELYERIDRRIDRMMEMGLVQEVKGLLDAGYKPGLSSMSAIGYKQIIQHLEGKVTLEEAIDEIRRKTRQYVRQQANWFKENDPSIHWFSARHDPIDGMITIIQQFLS